MRDADINSILAYCDTLLQEIETKHHSSLEIEVLDPVLPIKVKTLMEQCRTVLDYLAQDVYEKVIGTRGPKSRIYFPYGESEAKFSSAIDSNLPSLETLNQDIYQIIHEAQMISLQRLLMWPSHGHRWLVDLCNITNSQKHDRLTPHVLTAAEYRALHVGGTIFNLDQLGGSGIINTPTGTVEMKDGVITNQFGDAAEGTVRWVSLRFEGTKIDILPFLQTILHRVKVVQERVYVELQKLP